MRWEEANRSLWPNSKSMKSLCLRCPYSFFPEYKIRITKGGSISDGESAGTIESGSVHKRTEVSTMNSVDNNEDDHRFI